MDNNRDNRGLLPEAHLHPAEFDNAVKVWGLKGTGFA